VTVSTLLFGCLGAALLHRIAAAGKFGDRLLRLNNGLIQGHAAENANDGASSRAATADRPFGEVRRLRALYDDPESAQGNVADERCSGDARVAGLVPVDDGLRDP
jgi:hypothetical protein